ncbi:outer envelope protein 39, chloroplastic isoform X1 [Typha angustifolia]|uniref:outer envelope protein 39, chloroplastic isoform X1 n=1 Tax=Typha angustifolia TaxID=59011 RepID=UPI003C2D0ABA
MGAQKSIHAGKAKIDFNVDFSHKLSEAISSDQRSYGTLSSQIIGSLSVKHPNLFGRNEKLDILWDKGLKDSNILIALRRPRPEWYSQQSFVFQHSITPEIAVHGEPKNDFTRSESSGINLCRFSLGLDLDEPSTSNWLSTTSIKFEHIRPINDEGRSIIRDSDGFPITSSGNQNDNMVVLKQESEYAVVNDDSFSRLNFQMEQGLPLLPKWLVFNRFKFTASKGIKLGRTFLTTSLTGGSIVGDMAPCQAFTIGGFGNVRGYGEGAAGSGRSCLVANSELTVPLRNELQGAIFMDCGTDLNSSWLVPGNPALRHGKPGFGIGFGFGIRLNSRLGQVWVDYAINAFRGKGFYFGVNNVGS